MKAIYASNRLSRKSAPRYETIDILRIISAFGIVSFHSRFEKSDFGEAFYSGLVCFIIISVAFAMRPEQGAFSERLIRMKRIMIPWAFWSLIFLAREIYKGSGPELNLLSFVAHVIAGTSVHLWYLPFIVAVTTFLIALQKAIPLRVVEIIALAGIMLLTATVALWRPWSLDLPLPLPQYLHAFFPVLAGVIISVDSEKNATIGCLLVAACALMLTGYDGVGVPYLIGFLACWFAFRYRERFRTRGVAVTIFANSMFGVYLVHPLLFLPSRVLVDEAKIVYPLLVFGMSVGVVMIVYIFGSPTLKLLFGLPRGDPFLRLREKDA